MSAKAPAKPLQNSARNRTGQGFREISQKPSAFGLDEISANYRDRERERRRFQHGRDHSTTPVDGETSKANIEHLEYLVEDSKEDLVAGEDLRYFTMLAFGIAAFGIAVDTRFPRH